MQKGRTYTGFLPFCVILGVLCISASHCTAQSHRWTVSSPNGKISVIIAADTGNNRLQIFQLDSFSEYGGTDIVYLDQINTIADLSLPGDVLTSPQAVVCQSLSAKQIIYVADSLAGGRVLKIVIPKDPPVQSPLHTWESFKAALYGNDSDTALTLVAEVSREKYDVIFEAIQPHLQDFVEGMGDMTITLRYPRESDIRDAAH